MDDLYTMLPDSESHKIKNCCNNINIHFTKEYNVCISCGTIVHDIISEDINNKYIDDNLNPFSKLSTIMQKGSNSFICKNGKYIKHDIYKLHVQTNYDNKQKSYNETDNIINNYTRGKYNDNILKTSKELWVEIMKSNKIVRGSCRKGLIMCCIYYSCIYHNCNRTPLEISNDFCQEDNKIFNKGDKIFKEIFKDNEKWSFIISTNVSCENYINRFCNKLVENKLIKECNTIKINVLDNYNLIKDKLNYISPSNLAISLIYYNCKNIDKFMFSNCFNISTNLLLKNYNIIKTELKIS